jgi:transcriptional regulator GlxA family with amidase domain
MFAEELRRRYPAVTVTADRMIVDNGDVLTSGGATAFLNLALYLVDVSPVTTGPTWRRRFCWSTATAQASSPTLRSAGNDLMTT